MKVPYIILFLFLCLLILLLPVKIQIFYQRKNDKEKVMVNVKILFIHLNRKLSAPFVKILSLMSQKKYEQKNIKNVMQKKDLPKKNWGLILRRINIWFPRAIQIFSHSLKLASNIFKPIKCKRLTISCDIGLFNAAQTGVAIGGMWAIFSFLIAQLSKWMNISPDTPQIKITPDFYNTRLHLESDCIIVFPLGHIIIVMVQAVRFLRISTTLINGITSPNKL